MTTSKKIVVVGMSGGVDSSVSALLLKQQGYEVIGMFMKNWEEADAQGVCNASKEYADVVAVCEQIGMRCYSVNFVKEYREHVFTHFLEEYRQGYTPNPDILCNREIKFKAMYEKALELGADYLATGHYCQTDGVHLLKGRDPGKDQSYFLYTLKSDILSKILFPVGHLLKSEVRDLARQHGLATSEKKDSTGICFIGERNFKQFLGQYLEASPGNFENLDGKVVGNHEGAAYYTMGQRRGMGIGGAGEAWFVVGKDISRNVVYVDQGTRHPALYCDELEASEISWVDGEPVAYPFSCRSKVRYRQPDQECQIVSVKEGKASVQFRIPQRVVTPRQSIVFYADDICLGGAVIDRAGTSYHARGISLPAQVSL